jgi:hypothetical protein
LQVSANGILEFRHQPPANYCSQILERVESTIENHTFIAVFYGDVDVTGDEGGSISYSEPVVTDENSLERAKQQIRNLTQYTSFEPTYLIVATWDKVGYHKKQNDSLNTFQCVVATDGEMTFAIFLYNKLDWSQGQNTSVARVGFYGTERDPWEMPCSGTQNITSLVNSSNIGENGIWLFRIDQDPIEPACTDRATCGEDKLCSCLIDNNSQCLCKNTAMSGEDDLTCNVDTVCPDNCIVTVTQTIPPSVEGAQPSGSTPAIVLGGFFGLETVIVFTVIFVINY